MRGWPKGLVTQVALGVSLGITVMWLLTIAGTALAVRHELDELMDAALQETAARLLPLALLEVQDRPQQGTARIDTFSQEDDFLSYVVRDGQGAIQLHSQNAVLADFDGQLADGVSDTATLRVFQLRDAQTGFRIEVAEPHAERREAVMETVRAMILPLFILVPLLGLGIVTFIRRALAPVNRFHDEITRRDGMDMRPVALGDLPPEIASIAEAVNGLLDRLRRTLEAERSFTANSAHELRTPIAACLAQTQRLLAETQDPRIAERAAQIEAQLRRLARVAEKLMHLARAEGGAVASDAPQDLLPILAHVVREFRATRDGQRLRLDLPDGDGACLARIDPDAFGILARNLIENALTHGTPGTPVEVSMTPNATLRVVNAGPVVPPETLARLTRRFTRGDTRTEGSGLGLAIADSIARGVGGQLELLSPAPGRPDGFQATFHPQ